jgi:hypothetical protein
MNQVVHVFIASTKGLVAVQNITDLNDPDLQSVITLGLFNESLVALPIDLIYLGT